MEAARRPIGAALPNDELGARLVRYGQRLRPDPTAQEFEPTQYARKTFDRLILALLLGLTLLAAARLAHILLLGAPSATAIPSVGLVIIGLLLVRGARRIRARMDNDAARSLRAWQQREIELNDVAGRDELTDLQNRRFFFQRLSQEFEAAVNARQSLAVILIDVDDLKKINDEFGHGVGDAVLRAFARVLKRRARLGYVTARLGGDEFAVIMPGAGRREAEQFADHIWQDLSAGPLVESGTASIYLGVSVGVAGFPWAGTSVDELVQWADAKMYANKLERKGVPTSAAKYPDARLVDTVVDVLCAALDVRDQMTHRHARRVARMSVRVAQAMGLGDEMIREIQYAAALHDIGKIGVTDRILRKPGALTDAEWHEMRRHSDLGYQILKGIDFLSASAEIVRAHHECWDGSGYPQGLKGEEIPIGSRVFAVVDAYDAMTSRRPYRAALLREDALEEIQRGAGKQFDPKVVEAFLRVVAENPGGFRSPLDGDEGVEDARPEATEDEGEGDGKPAEVAAG